MVTKNAFLYNDYWYAILNLLITLLQFSRLFKSTLFSVQMQQSNGFIGTGQSCGKKENAMLKIKKCTWTRQTTAWENGGYLATPPAPLVSRRNDVWETGAPGQLWVVLLIVASRGKFASTNQKYYPDLGGDASSVRNFCARLSHVISRETTSWRRKMLAVFLR